MFWTLDFIMGCETGRSELGILSTGLLVLWFDLLARHCLPGLYYLRAWETCSPMMSNTTDDVWFLLRSHCTVDSPRHKNCGCP